MATTGLDTDSCSVDLGGPVSRLRARPRPLGGTISTAVIVTTTTTTTTTPTTTTTTGTATARVNSRTPTGCVCTKGTLPLRTPATHGSKQGGSPRVFCSNTVGGCQWKAYGQLDQSEGLFRRPTPGSGVHHLNKSSLLVQADRGLIEGLDRQVRSTASQSTNKSHGEMSKQGFSRWWNRLAGTDPPGWSESPCAGPPAEQSLGHGAQAALPSPCVETPHPLPCAAARPPLGKSTPLPPSQRRRHWARAPQPNTRWRVS